MYLSYENTICVLTCVSGKLLSDVALCFSQMRLFSEASECYEQALPLVSSKPHRLAVVLQNLGAVYNSLGQYQQSLRYHREAAALHGETHTPQTRNTRVYLSHVHVGDQCSNAFCFRELICMQFFVLLLIENLHEKFTELVK